MGSCVITECIAAKKNGLSLLENWFKRTAPHFLHCLNFPSYVILWKFTPTTVNKDITHTITLFVYVALLSCGLLSNNTAYLHACFIDKFKTTPAWHTPLLELQDCRVHVNCSLPDEQFTDMKWSAIIYLQCGWRNSVVCVTDKNLFRLPEWRCSDPITPLDLKHSSDKIFSATFTNIFKLYS